MDILNSLNSIDSIVKYVENNSIDSIIQEVSELLNISIEKLSSIPVGGYLKGKISDSYYVVVMDIKENIYKYEWLYHRLGDTNSKRVLLNLLRYRLTTSISFIENAFDRNNVQYFDKNIIKCEEINSIIGAKNHIKNDSPKLAICLYHRVSDLWEIPELIDSINSNYEFYIRHYEKSLAWETVLYAIPQTKNISYENNKKGFYLVPFEEDLIRNVILTKDVGLIPYFMHKKRGYNSVLIAGKDETRPYLDKYVNGLKIELINSKLSFDEGISNYIAHNYKKMDVLMLIGIYETYFNQLKFYKKLRPDGKVYLKLDANSHWMDRIDFNSSNIVGFLSNVNVISVESKQMKKYLSSKIPYKKIEYVPNGYLDYVKNQNIYYRDKENTIITVGRIGSAEKNNEVLLEAFSLIAEEIPNWKLKLVGNISENFKKYIQEYFNRNPKLISRVIFTGNIDSKEDLFEEYKKSKIFVLTSICEGGSPNVYSEAALNGNYIITSNIDACMDMTNNLKCGDVFNIGDVSGLAKILLKRCQDNKYLESKCEEIKKYIRNYFDYEKIVLKIDYLLDLE